ncbi:CDP-alcohol phosphatidyltransferase family protein [Psychroflexus aestuariivivens]|uniref:CDP-alcohol phosphatidyltransferase family protein n=1 Tax=Psychroflexus aestuariivivens TaxID=1795040 RepID=UPI000FD8B587|nr:CDP-alcohol phosphatidyltransferase family protein [Psychroflexus aestuariivivens]
MIKKHIPNFITLMNLLFGCVAVIFAVQGNLLLSGAFVCLGIFFDFFDGLAARLLNVKSDLGLQLDSLADMVTSGVVPGIIMCQLIATALGDHAGSNLLSSDTPWMVYVGLIITLASCYRLAKFNIDDRQTDAFIGLPTPANAIFILSLALIADQQSNSFLVTWIENPYILILISVLSALILNAELKLFSLKVKNLNFKTNWYRYFILILSVLGLVIFKYVAIPFIIVLYILLSIIVNTNSEQKEN